MLTDRLKTICSLLPPCDTFADVGCDHGLVSKYVYDNSLARTIYALDVSDKCLQKAMDLIGEKEGVNYVCTDGLDGIPKVDVAVICGMGAKEIQAIISRIDYKPYLVLGAHKNVKSLREYLTGNGYKIVKDCVVKEGKIFYDVICATKGEQTLDEVALQEGAFYTQPSPFLKERVEEEIKTYSRFPQTEKNSAFIDNAKQVLKWQN